MRWVAMRVDASLTLGYGHAMRCLTLANQLRGAGAEVWWLTRRLPESLAVQTQAAGIHLLPLPPLARFDQASDARQCQEALEQAHLRLDWLVVDHYELDVHWESAMRAFAGHLMVIDDLADRRHNCDLLLDQNLYRDLETRYADLVPATAQLLLGPSYALLRPEFAEARHGLRERTARIDHVLVSFGGSDPTGETEKVIAAIAAGGFSELVFDIVLGGSEERQADVAKRCSALTNTAFHGTVQDMARWMIRADLAIGASGSTTWERCCLGLPALVVSVAPNQDAIAEASEFYGIGRFLGDAAQLTPEAYRAALQRLVDDPAPMVTMSETARNFVDGLGAARVAEQLFQVSAMTR